MKIDYRPKYHFTPKANWINDPNGLVYHNGEYHLFYQYYPEGTVWGPMHWGHAVSKDLVKWEELDIALYPGKLGQIFSGSAVVDKENTSGLFEKQGGIVAIYTNHLDRENMEAIQMQSIAYSKDSGRTWEKYQGNPVIPNPGIKDIRDPKVFWYKEEKSWIMILAAGDHARFYRSYDLKTWDHLSDFGFFFKEHEVWECPDIFKFDEEWVFQVSIVDLKNARNNRVIYWTGKFDGESFIPNENKIKLMDYGKDFYAVQSWSNVDKCTIGAWMSNWGYARNTPTETWRGCMNFPREVELKKSCDEAYIVQTPVKEIEKYRVSEKEFEKECEISKFSDIVLEFEEVSEDFTFYLFDIKEGAKLSYEKEKMELVFDRTNCGEVGFHEQFPVKSKIELEEELKELRILVDNSCVEIFANKGKYVLSSLAFPKTEKYLIKLSDGEVKLNKAVVYELGV